MQNRRLSGVKFVILRASSYTIPGQQETLPKSGTLAGNSSLDPKQPAAKPRSGRRPVNSWKPSRQQNRCFAKTSKDTVQNMKTLLRAILQTLAQLALFVLGTLVAGFFLVIFLIGGWPLTILLLFVAIQKIYFPPDVRRNIAAKFNRPHRYVAEPRFKAMPIRESTQKPATSDLCETDERIPRLLN